MGIIKKSCLVASCAIVLMVSGVAWGQCPNVETRGNYIVKKGSWIPGDAMGYGFTGDTSYYWYLNNFYVASNCGGGVCNGCGSCSGTGWSDVSGKKRFSVKWAVTGCSGCGYGYWDYYMTAYTIAAYGTAHDYDCDGINDLVDADDLNPPADADQDGVPDEDDPWPNDANCPGTGANWKISGSWTNKTSSCNYTIYTDVSGTCSDAYATDCTTETLTNTADWWFNIPANNEPGVWPGSGEETSGSPTSPDDQPNNEGEYARMIQELNEIKQNTKDTVSKLAEGNSGLDDVKGSVDAVKSAVDAVKTAVEGIEGGSLDTGPITSRQDAQTGVLNDIKDKIIPMGAGSLPDADLEDVNDNSSVSDETNVVKLESEKSTLTAFLDGWWASNPVKSVVDGSGITASGSPSIPITLSFGTTSFDVGALGPGLNSLGLVLVGLAGLAGVITLVRD